MKHRIKCFIARFEVWLIATCHRLTFEH